MELVYLGIKGRKGKSKTILNLISEKSIKAIQGAIWFVRRRRDENGISSRYVSEDTNAFVNPWSYGARHCGKPRGTQDLIPSLRGHFGFALTLRPGARRTSCLGERLGNF